jgi:hypothetical protein
VHAIVSTSSKVRKLAVASAAGTLTLVNGGGTVALTGSYDSTTGALSLSGGGYNFSGMVAKGEATGSFTLPDGNVGTFTTLDATNTTVTDYCGTFQEPEDHGVWNIETTSSGALAGSAYGNHSLTLIGTVSGGQFTAVSDRGGTVAGTIANGQVSGTITPAAGTGGGSGTFSGAVC